MSESFEDVMRNNATDFSYPGCEEDKAECERLYVEFATPRYFRSKLTAMGHKQRLHDGDRSHPDIMALENTEFSYLNWQADYEECLKRHTGDCSTTDLGETSFRTYFNSMKKKQAVFCNRSNITCLRELDKMLLTFPGWEDDKEQAEQYYIRFDSTFIFQKKVKAIRNKQNLYDGDRSDPVLQELDTMKLTYKNWEVDVHKAMHVYTGDCYVLDLGTQSFRNLLRTMRKKQLEADNGFGNAKNNIFFQEIDDLNLRYIGSEDDVRMAKQFYFKFDSKKPFFDKVLAMKNRQRLNDGDRSHPDIHKLDTTIFTYDGWELDKEEAVRRHIGDCSILDLGNFAFDAFLKKMEKKEAVAQQKRARYFQELNSAMQRVSSEKSLPDLAASIRSIGSSSSNEGDSVVNDGMCIVCYENEASHAFIPCGHLCLCSGCTVTYDLKFAKSEATCPICRARSVCATKIFR